METVRIQYTAVSETELLYVDARLKDRMSRESWLCEDYLDALVCSSMALYVRPSCLFIHEGHSP